MPVNPIITHALEAINSGSLFSFLVKMKQKMQQRLAKMRDVYTALLKWRVFLIKKKKKKKRGRDEKKKQKKLFRIRR